MELRKELAETYEAGPDAFHLPTSANAGGNVQPLGKCKHILFGGGISDRQVLSLDTGPGDQRTLKHHLLMIHGYLVREKTWNLCIYIAAIAYSGCLLDSLE